MSRMPPRLRFYVQGVMAAGALAVLAGLGLVSSLPTRLDLVVGVVLVALSAVAYLAPIKLAARRQLVLHISLLTIAFIALPPGLAGLVAGLSVLIGNAYRGRRLMNGLFNAAHTALGTVIAAALYHGLSASSHGIAATTRPLYALVVGGVALFIVSTLAVDGATAIQRHRSLLTNWWPAHKAALSSHMIMVVLGGAVALAAQRAPWLVVLALAPVLAIQVMLNSWAQFDAHLVALAEEIADAVDEHHPFLSGASRKIGALALRTGRAYGLPEEDSRRIMLAAHLHNIAAATLPDYIQLGMGMLDEHQRSFWQTHCQRGGDLIEKALGLTEVAKIIRFHHERIDGKGYPYGLHGADIPRDAFILAVCESWVALTSDRGYRPALPPQNAWAVLQAGAGSQWSAAAVEALGEVVAAEIQRRSVSHAGTGETAAAVA